MDARVAINLVAWNDRNHRNYSPNEVFVDRHVDGFPVLGIARGCG